MTLPITMLVERDAHVRCPLASRLRQRGLQVVEAESAAEAHGLAEFGHIDVVIATQAFADQERLAPRSSRVRVRHGAALLPLVLLSADGVRADGAFRTAASAVLPETCEIDELVMVLHRVANAR